MKQAKAGIIYNKRVNANYFHLCLESAAIAGKSQPGQFVNIKVNNSLEPLLRRPLSVHHIQGAQVEFLYEVIGQGTEILSQRKPEELLGIIGPLGNGFDLSAASPQRPAQILVAGGMGVAPLVFLAEKLVHGSQSSAVHKRPIVLIGAGTESQVLCEKEFRKLGRDVKIATDDGSCGFKGRVTALLESMLSTVNCQLSTIYACGPRPMLKEISRLSKEYKIPAQISLEEHMACGIGACLGCVVNTKNGYQRVCKDGPVFNAEEIIW